ncbi:NADH:ubiquinone oxidoreductase subunit NDUFA12 [Dongia soli]|uniref:NADH:ubiquinone oxidoreductase subunit NDUFA12 n=1 Tax=Dongia soli TaxID=600628 RepID=UPI00361E2DD6
MRAGIVTASIFRVWREMSFGTRLFTMFYGELVGTDEFGNKYYIDRRTKGQKRERRWVIYNGSVEASRVPPVWHAWLHRTTVTPPTSQAQRKTWQKPHQPNLTGTDHAYFPDGHAVMGGQRAKATGDYEPWVPN